VDNGMDNRIQRLTLDKRNQDTLMALAIHSITFPVTKALMRINNDWLIVNRSLIWDKGAPVVGTISFTANLFATQGTVKVAA